MSNNFPKIVAMCEEGGRSEKMFEGKCKGEINSFILFFLISCNLEITAYICNDSK